MNGVTNWYLFKIFLFLTLWKNVTKVAISLEFFFLWVTKWFYFVKHPNVKIQSFLFVMRAKQNTVTNICDPGFCLEKMKTAAHQ